MSSSGNHTVLEMAVLKQVFENFHLYPDFQLLYMTLVFLLFFILFDLEMMFSPA